jgi:SRSO17 transposase
MEASTTVKTKDLLCQWGLPLDEIDQLGQRLTDFYGRFREKVRTRTHDTSDYGLHYLSGLLRMDRDRNMANIGRTTGVVGQNLQHFMSNSPWSAAGLITAVQDEVRQHPEFQTEAILAIDESAEVKAGPDSAGASRQHNGRLGKVEMSQVGVFGALVTPRVNLWIAGELYLAERWFTDAYAVARRSVGIPEQRTFKTKPELAWEIIQQVHAQGVPFVAVDMDDLYGRNTELRQQLRSAGIEYYGDVPADTRVYLEEPQLIYPLTKRGKPAKQPKVTGAQPYTVHAVRERPEVEWAELTLRPNERGLLQAWFGRCRVWLVHAGECWPEWLLIRQDRTRVTYVLSNAAVETPLATMARRKSLRYFVERSNQDEKGELGWDEFQARKYRAWEHQLALTILASWFIAETRLDWHARFARDPALLEQYEVEVLPLLSVANVRALLRAALPLPQLSTTDAALLVVEHLSNRTRSRKSRLRKRQQRRPET